MAQVFLRRSRTRQLPLLLLLLLTLTNSDGSDSGSSSIIASMSVVQLVSARPPLCLPFSALAGVDVSLWPADNDGSSQYFCTKDSSPQFQCRCKLADKCKEYRSPWGRRIGRCGCCRAWVWVLLALSIVFIFPVFVLVFILLFCKGKWFYDAYPLPAALKSVRIHSRGICPPEVPLPPGMFRGYTSTDFKNYYSEAYQQRQQDRAAREVEVAQDRARQLQAQQAHERSRYGYESLDGSSAASVESTDVVFLQSQNYGIGNDREPRPLPEGWRSHHGSPLTLQQQQQQQLMQNSSAARSWDDHNGGTGRRNGSGRRRHSSPPRAFLRSASTSLVNADGATDGASNRRRTGARGTRRGASGSLTTNPQSQSYRGSEPYAGENEPDAAVSATTASPLPGTVSSAPYGNQSSDASR